jgi:hypothetical protein
MPRRKAGFQPQPRSLAALQAELANQPKPAPRLRPSLVRYEVGGAPAELMGTWLQAGKELGLPIRGDDELFARQLGHQQIRPSHSRIDAESAVAVLDYARQDSAYGAERVERPVSLWITSLFIGSTGSSVSGKRTMIARLGLTLTTDATKPGFGPIAQERVYLEDLAGSERPTPRPAEVTTEAHMPVLRTMPTDRKDAVIALEGRLRRDLPIPVVLGELTVRHETP